MGRKVHSYVFYIRTIENHCASLPVRRVEARVSGNRRHRIHRVLMCLYPLSAFFLGGELVSEVDVH